MSYIEVYNEQVKDLLAEALAETAASRRPHKGFYVEGVTDKVVRSVADIIYCLEKGEKGATSAALI